MRYQEGITVLDNVDCEVAAHACRHYLVWLDTVKATTKAAEPYGRAIEEEIALARSLRRSFEARAKKEEHDGENQGNHQTS